MDDQGLLRLPPFDRKDPPQGVVVGRIGAEPVNRFRRKGHHAAGTEQHDGPGDLSRCVRRSVFIQIRADVIDVHSEALHRYPCMSRWYLWSDLTPVLPDRHSAIPMTEACAAAVVVT